MLRELLEEYQRPGTPWWRRDQIERKVMDLLPEMLDFLGHAVNEFRKLGSAGEEVHVALGALYAKLEEGGLLYDRD